MNSLIFLAINEFEWVVRAAKVADDSNNPFCGGGAGGGGWERVIIVPLSLFRPYLQIN